MKNELSNNILILYSELMPYNIPVLKELVAKGYQLHVVNWDINKLSPYIAPSLKDVLYYKRSLFNPKSLLELFNQLQPRIVYVSGWMDPVYVKVVSRIKKETDVPIVAGCDTQWKGGKQWLNILFSRFRHRKWFTHLLVGGLRQYEYARRLGFESYQILTHVYSANTPLFSSSDLLGKRITYPKVLLYVGRLAPEKGIEKLIEAWKSLESNFGWRLKIIGSGPLEKQIKEQIQKEDDIDLIHFMSQEMLVEEMSKVGCFIIPSKFEPWALVIHEAAAAGLPILASNACGAADYFLISGYNGYLFDFNKDAIVNAILKVITLSEGELLQFSDRSRNLSKRISPELVANSILSPLADK